MRIPIPAIAALVAAALPAFAGSDAMEMPKTDFGPLAGLVGSWVGQSDTDHDGTIDQLEIEYKLTAGGSALVETMSPGTDHEMITVYTRDGDDVLATHYCMLANQPRLRAKAGGDGRKFDFQFESATGMASPDAMHMHSLVLDLPDADHLKQTWSNYDKGEKQGDVVFELTRKD
ncbi:MAG TPA: hypothetical protein VIH35_09135 [Kiritimatiellia bacterium]